MDKTSLVLTILGQDHPGLVDSLAAIVAEHGGNWVESRMAHLAGQFAGILRVEAPPEKVDALAAALRALNAGGLEAVIHPDATPAASRDMAPSRTVHLDLVGQDRPGIVREITRVLAAQGVNVEELATECTTAAESGQLLFNCTAELQLPPSLAVDQLRTALEQVAADLMVDVTLA